MLLQASPPAQPPVQPPVQPPAFVQPAQPLPSIALPPSLDRVLRDYEREWKAGNTAALAKLFTDDGFVLQNGRNPVRGHDAIRAAYGTPGGDLRLRALAYATGDSVGYIIGAYGYAQPGATGAPSDMGKFTLTLRRAAGGPWRIASDMDNANVRAPRP